jgi:hypothetical protein
MHVDRTTRATASRGGRWLARTVAAAALTAVLAAGLLVVAVERLSRTDALGYPGAHRLATTPVPSTQTQLASPRTLSRPGEGSGRRGHAPRWLARVAVSRIGRIGSFLIIPALNVRAPLVPTGAMGSPETATLTIPSDIQTVGWWDGVVRDGERTVREDAPAPGQPGVAVIAGHVDSAAAGPGALYELKELKVGDVIDISDSAARVSTWVVDATPQTALKTALPRTLWASAGAPRLALVTCGGPFDTATGHYVDNVIVWARLARSSP